MALWIGFIFGSLTVLGHVLVAPVDDFIFYMGLFAMIASAALIQANWWFDEMEKIYAKERKKNDD